MNSRRKQLIALATSRHGCYRDPWRVATALAFTTTLGASALALPASAQQPNPGDVTGDASVSGVAILDTDIDNGGSFRWDGFVAAGSIDWQLTQALSIGATLRYNYEHWRFSTPTAFGPTAPWTNVNMPQVGLNFELSVAPDLSLFVSPQIEWGYESGASASDAKIYGAAFGVTKIFSPTLVLGIGAGSIVRSMKLRSFPS